MGDLEIHRPEGVRLQKVLAQAGVGSRRHCEDLIEAGLIFAGTPDQVTQQIKKFTGAMGGFDNLLLMFQGGDLGHAETTNSLSLFGREVLPQLSSEPFTSPEENRAVATA